MEKSEKTVGAELRSALDQDGMLSCEAAHEIAERLDIKPGEIGNLANDLGIRITRCQLGLFGYAPGKGTPGYRLVRELDTLPEPVSAQVKETAVKRRVSCIMLWRIARQHGVSRPDMGNIAETLKIKVTPCQLGCF